MRIFSITKWGLVAVFLFAAFSAHASAIPGLTIYSPDLESELDAHWTFDAENMTTVVADRTGVNNGALILGATGNVATTTTSGVLGQALLFDGTSDYINFPVIETVDSFPVAFSVWFKTTQTTQGYFVDQGGEVQFYINGGNVTYAVLGAGTASITSAADFNDGRWHHAVGVSRAHNDHELYIDGVSVGTSATTANGADASAITVIGRSISAVGYYQGALDDVRIYDRAISLSEIQRLRLLGSAFKVGVSTLVAGDARTRIASTPIVPAGQGLIGHWTFDGKNLISNVTDSSSEGNTGRLILSTSGNTATTTSPGVLGQALLYDGTNDYVTIADDASLDVTSAITVAGWVKLDIKTRNQGIAYKGSFANTFGPWALSYTQSSSPDGFYWTIGNSALIAITSDASAGVWYHVAGTYDGQTARVYLNGVLEDSDAYGSPTNLATDNNAVQLGRYYGTSINRYLQGALDDVRIYNRALSGAEIQQLYRTGQPREFASRQGNRAPTPSDAGRLPVNGSNLGGGTQNYTLRTNVWTDPDGDSVTGYYFEYFENGAICGSSPTGNSGWIADPTGTGGYTVSVVDGSTNSWRVKARDASGKESAWNTCYVVYNSGGGSCPYVFGWNGEKFVFEVDIFGSGGLGYKKWGLDDFVQPAPNRTYVIGNDELLNDAFEWRIVGDLNEVDYFDYFRLYSVFVPKDRDIIVESPTLGSGLKAKSILHTVSTEPLLPKAAVRLDTNKDVTEDVSARDDKKVIINKEKKETYEPVLIEVDFGDISQYPTRKLIIGGSTTYPVTEEGIARKQQFGLEWGLYVQDEAGEWRKVPNNLYSPTKPLSFDSLIAVDISKIFISKNTKIRLEYLYKVYVDYIALDVTEDLPVEAAEEHPIIYADLHDFAGWHEFNKDGHMPDYYDVTNLEEDYEDFPGYYTKFGDVIPLLEKRDDKFVVMAKADEVTVKNAAPKLSVPEGYKRVVMLDVTGYYKALGKTQTGMAVEPMPFSGMSMFPYPDTEHYPDTPEYQAYLSEWNTRYLSPEKRRGNNALLGGAKRLWINLWGQ